jgi:hypothetical protein
MDRCLGGLSRCVPGSPDPGETARSNGVMNRCRWLVIATSTAGLLIGVPGGRSQAMAGPDGVFWFAFG